MRTKTLALSVSMLALVPMLTVTTAAPRRQDAPDYSTYTLKGAAGTDCDKFNGQLKEDRARWAAFYSNFAEGFLTGSNFHAMLVRRGNPNVGKGMSSDAILSAMEQFCSQRPHNDVADALTDFYDRQAPK
jgi:hypothetical protein